MPYETAKHSKFEPVFTRVNWAPIRPYAIVVDNPTGKAVLGLAIRWTYTNLSGPGELNFITDSFYGGSLATSPAHTPILVVPGAATSAAYVNTPSLLPAPDPDLVHRLNLSTNITAAVDAVIFEDGEIVGPDQTGIQATIEGRDAALRMLVDIATKAQQAGQDVNKAVKDRVAQSSGEAPTEEWLRRLGKTPPGMTYDQLIRVFNNRRALPKFYRR